MSLNDDPPPGQTADFAFPIGGGELGAMIRTFDWSGTSLGSMAGWPQSLKTATDILLRSPLPMVMLWGPEGVMIYNDGYSVFAGQRHPGLLGSKVREGWPEVAEFNDHVLDVVLQGGTLSFKNQELTLYRNNAPEQVWMDLNYGPVLGENGQPAGVLAIVVETTGKVTVERALEEANKRLASETLFLRQLFEQAPSFMAVLQGPEHRIEMGNPAYMRLVGHRDLIGKTVAEALPDAAAQGYVELLDGVFASGTAYRADGAKYTVQPEPGGPVQERYLDFVYQPITDAAGKVTGIFLEGQDVTARFRGEQHMRLMINELNHRVKNTLAMMQAIAAQTFRNADDLVQANASFSARIIALARANDLLTERKWEGASLRDVIGMAVSTHGGPERDRFSIDGPPVRLSPKTALSLSIAAHELATNAVKYGALSNETGKTTVRWRIEPSRGGDRLRFEWRESGGPPVMKPARRGFGSRMIERGLAAELGGEVQLAFEPEGLVCLIDAPLSLYEEASR